MVKATDSTERHSEFVTLTASITAATELLKLTASRPNKFCVRAQRSVAK